MILAPTRELAL
jgi:superfamily II DNA/RNA helicase